MKKKLGLVLTIMLALSMSISLVNAENWVEVARITGGTHEKVKTESFNLHTETRFGW